MVRLWLAAVAGLLFAPPPVAASNDIEVMVLGTWHFANHNRDLHNVSSDDVRAPARQRELEAVAAALAEFRPTKVMIEKVAPAVDLIDPDYAAFTPALLRTERSERFQLGYRLAHALGLARVQAIDEQAGPGEPDYFPYGQVADYAQAHGSAALLQDAHAQTRSLLEAFNRRQASATLAELLLEANRPSFMAGIDPYYRMLRIGDTERQPGAELNAMWYLRNAKIFAKLATGAEPGDRILVIYGAGHVYWLRHFAAETPGFRNVDPAPFLERAGARLRAARAPSAG